MQVLGTGLEVETATNVDATELQAAVLADEALDALEVMGADAVLYGIDELRAEVGPDNAFDSIDEPCSQSELQAAVVADEALDALEVMGPKEMGLEHLLRDLVVSTASRGIRNGRGEAVGAYLTLTLTP